MTVYTLILIRSITDQSEFSLYGEGYMKVWNKFNGKILSITETPTVIEGDWPYVRNVLLSFPNAEDMNAWYHSPEYQTLAQHRHRSSTADAIILPGFGESAPTQASS